MGLCTCSVGCLAWNIPALKPTGYWVGLVLVGEWRPPGGLMPMSAHQSCCCQCHFPCSEPHPLLTSKEDPLVLAGRSFPISYEVTAFFLVHARPCGCPPRMEFLFLQSCGIPALKPCCPSKSESLGDPPPIDRPQVCEAWHGDQDFHSYGRTSMVSIFSSLWVTHLTGVGFYFIMITPLLLSYCGFFFVLDKGNLLFFFRYQQFFVNGCSAVSCHFGVFMRKGELPSYSVILLASPNFYVLENKIDSLYISTYILSPYRKHIYPLIQTILISWILNNPNKWVLLHN